MSIRYVVLLVLILMISWINWRLLIQLFPNTSFQGCRYLYWLVTGLAWLLINYTWLVRPEPIFFHQWIAPLVDLSYVWVIAGMVLLCLFPILFIMRRLSNRVNSGQKSRETSSMDVSRRTFLQSMLYASPILALGVSAKGVYSAECEMVVRQVPLSFRDLPQDLQGFKIAQISDTHIGPFFSLERLDEVLQFIIAEKPDMVVITGDLIDDLTLLEPAIRKLNQFFTLIPYGIYFCWGNHEYFRDINRIRRELAKSPIYVLENSNLPVKIGKTTFYVSGVDYPWPKDPGEWESIQQDFMIKAKDNIPSDAFRVLLAHHPDFLFNAFAEQIPLTLSGHTHGGQVNLLGKSLLPVRYHYMRGLYQENDSYGYVSPGTGQWIPFRLGCPPEISVFTLTAK
jgi:predicted MPP superfamily phosphohydrolase